LLSGINGVGKSTSLPNAYHISAGLLALLVAGDTFEVAPSNNLFTAVPPDVPPFSQGLAPKTRRPLLGGD
jgi:hypothetical protein